MPRKEGTDEQFVEEEEEEEEEEGDDDVEMSKVQPQTSGKQSISFLESTAEQKVFSQSSNVPAKPKVIGPTLPAPTALSDELTGTSDTQSESKHPSACSDKDNIHPTEAKQKVESSETKAKSGNK